MKLILSKNYSPFFNLPLEEIMLKDEENQEDLIFLYQNENSVIVGRNQNTNEEIKRDVLEKAGVALYRRISGGGAVYQDLGNICFAFITNKGEHNYAKFLTPIIEFLQSLGLDAKFKGRNDLEVNGAKVSGNAQFIYKNRIVHHGTLLFNANLEKLSEFLIPSPLKIASKGIKSMRQRVTNILDELETKITINEFIEKLATFLIQKYQAKLIEPSEKNLKQLETLSSERASEKWLYGSNPGFEIVNEQKFEKGILKVSLNVEKNLITNIKFEGDFLSQRDVSEVATLFLNKEYNKLIIKQILSKISLNEYFGGIKDEEIISLIFGD